MFDWNGNGKIDPVDVGISIAAQTWEGECGTEESGSNAGKEKSGTARRESFIKVLLKKLLGGMALL